MRLRSALALGATAAALTIAAVAAPTVAEGVDPVLGGVVAREVTCDDGGNGDFPVTSRIHGGPTAYRPGDGPRSWKLDLANISDVTCGNIHPVVVLQDRDRDLRTGQVRMEFQDPDGHWHPVPFERSDRDEYVGVFDYGFTGFSLAPRSSITVPVRLAFASDTGENEVTAHVAVVQRRDDDGDWVGRSNSYTFTIGGEPAAGERRPPWALAKTGSERHDELLGLGVAAGALLIGGAALVMVARRLFGPRR